MMAQVDSLEWRRMRPSTMDCPRAFYAELVGCILIVLAAGGVAGAPGILAGIGVLLAWVTFGPPIAIAVGYVLLTALVAPALTTTEIVVISTGFVVLILAPVVGIDRPGRFVLRTAIILGVLAGLGWLALETTTVWMTAVVLLLGIGVSSYGLHRLGILRLNPLADTGP